MHIGLDVARQICGCIDRFVSMMLCRLVCVLWPHRLVTKWFMSM